MSILARNRIYASFISKINRNVDERIHATTSQADVGAYKITDYKEETKTLCLSPFSMSRCWAFGKDTKDSNWVSSEEKVSAELAGFP